MKVLFALRHVGVVFAIVVCGTTGLAAMSGTNANHVGRTRSSDDPDAVRLIASLNSAKTEGDEINIMNALAENGVSVRKIDGVYVNANQEALSGHTIDDVDLHALSKLNFLEQNYGYGALAESISEGRSMLIKRSWGLSSEANLGRHGIVVLWDSQKRIYQVASTLRSVALPVEQKPLSMQILSVDTVTNAVHSVAKIRIFWPEQPLLYAQAANHLYTILRKGGTDEVAKTALSNLFKQIVELPVEPGQEGGASLLWLNFDLARGFLFNKEVRSNEAIRTLVSWKIEDIRKTRASLQPIAPGDSVGATLDEELDSDAQGNLPRRAFLRVLEQYEEALSRALSRKP